MKHHLVIILVSLFCCVTVLGQETRSWEQVWQELNSAEDMEEEEWTDVYEQLQQLAEHPIDLNCASRDDLQQLPFLSEQQVMDLVEYIDRYKPLRSMNELRMIRSMDYVQLSLLPFFVYVGEVKRQEPSFPRWDNILKYGKQTLTATGRLPFYKRKGDVNGYLGYRYRHSLRYEFSYGHYVKAGFMGTQDAGEPFFAGQNAWGYDAYSYYVQLRKMGFVENLVAGKYKVSAGMGLVLGSSFSLGKLATLQSLGRQTATLRVHSSRSEADYFQGIGATFRLSKPLALTAFASYRPIDATLNDDGTAATLITSGYHRTPAEMQKKHNTHLTAFGASLAWSNGPLRLGVNAVTTSIDRLLKPNTKVLYRRYYAKGSRFTNASIDYGYSHYRFSLRGETAVNADGALATVNTLSYQPRSQLGLMLSQRFYSYRYTGLYAHSFGTTTHTQNESGVYLGFTWQALRRLHLLGYIDYAYHPWPRYQVSQSSDGYDFLMQADYRMGKCSVQARHRMQLREKDDENKKRLIPNNEHRSRLTFSYEPMKGCTAKTQVDMVFSKYKETSRGWMVSKHLTIGGKRWLMSGMAGYFDTDAYESRIYVYERQLRHEFYFPSFYGQGMHMSLLARASVTTNLSTSAKIGFTNYFDRPTIGTGLQQIAHSHATDLDLQLRWSF